MAEKLLLTAQHVFSILGPNRSELDLLIRLVYRVVTLHLELLSRQNLMAVQTPGFESLRNFPKYIPA